jgi:hypothetical protein
LLLHSKHQSFWIRSENDLDWVQYSSSLVSLRDIRGYYASLGANDGWREMAGWWQKTPRSSPIASTVEPSQWIAFPSRITQKLGSPAMQNFTSLEKDVSKTILFRNISIDNRSTDSDSKLPK